MNLIGRKIKMFRCVIDPQSPPKPRNAFTMGSGPDQLAGEAFRTDAGILVRTPVRAKDPVTGEQILVVEEYEIFIGNLGVAKYFPQEPEIETKKIKVIK